MHKFDYGFLNKHGLNNDLFNLSATIYTMQERSNNQKNNYIKIYSELEKIAKVQSVKASNAIEGIITSEERINSIVNENSKPVSHPEEEIAGYKDALNYIHSNYNNIEISEDTIINLYKILISYTSNKQNISYKKEDNLIVELNEQGERIVRFRPTKAKDTKKAIEQLILAYIDARYNEKINDLLLIACFIFDFTCIHPFSDGNGRISRLLTLLLLYKAGFEVGKYISLEAQISNYKNEYYEALKESSNGWEYNTNSYIPFIHNFLFNLYKCYKELDYKFLTINDKKANKTNRVEATVLNSVVPISKKEICNILPDVSPTTVEAVIGKLVKDGKIVKIGTARSTKYYKKILR